VSGDIAAIAAGLSGAQRNRVLSLMANENRMGGYGEDSGCPGIIERVGINHPLFGSHYRLTPLGLAVRSHLKGQSHE
jgi:hypothetical protein